MRVTYYTTDNRSQALKWKPHGDWCCPKECKYYTIEIFENLYGDDVREDPIEYESD